MFSLRFSLYVDSVLGSVLVMTGTGLSLCDALALAPDGTGSFGVSVLAIGTLLCIHAMFRYHMPHEHKSEDDGFDFDGEYARVHRLKS